MVVEIWLSWLGGKGGGFIKLKISHNKFFQTPYALINERPLSVCLESFLPLPDTVADDGRLPKISAAFIQDFPELTNENIYLH